MLEPPWQFHCHHLKREEVWSFDKVCILLTAVLQLEAKYMHTNGHD